MVHIYLETSNDIGKEIKVIVPSNLKGPSFHCPQYIKNLFYEKHITYKNIKPLAFLSNLYKSNVAAIGKHFIEKTFKLGWKRLKKKLAKPFFHSLTLYLSDKNGHELFTSTDQLNHWAELVSYTN
ncbi:hypothetical protein PIROE2DRAFT_13877 [Piromyces sp. E2]|nr:hypothetical protein PIROE2DRAFT_13877 [Piromyces sp. E2]|eukprot:OUM60371.1 hypothetical protein PIROE2DRAFT_13877 [Piromyces sp. E2]